MAEDFYNIFKRGSDKEINGQEVQMALWLAVQALSAKNRVLEQKVAALEHIMINAPMKLQKLELGSDHGERLIITDACYK